MILRGFVLKIENSGENDLNLIFFSEEEGKIKILVKGARKPLSKLRGLCQFFIFLELKIVKGKRNIHLIGGRELKIFKNIIESFKKIKETSFLLSTLNSFFPFFLPTDPPTCPPKLQRRRKLYAKEEKKEPKIFALSLKTLEKINSLSEEKTDLLKSAFLIKFLAFSGFKPELKKCLICHKLLLENFVFFDFKQGGLICSACQKTKNSDQIKISSEILGILQNLLYKDFDFLKEKNFSEKSLIEIDDILKKFLVWRQ